MAQTALTIALAVGWVAVAVRLGLDLAGHASARPGYRWLLGSLLIAGAGTLALNIADDRNWPVAVRHRLSEVVLLLAVPTLVLLLTGQAIRDRSQPTDPGQD